VIDANIIAQFHREYCGADSCALTGKVSPVFKKLGESLFAFVDDQGHIKNEWENTVHAEWLKHWYKELLRTGKLYEIPINNLHCRLKRKLAQLGFPRSKDFWYIRTYLEVCPKDEKCDYLLTEDIDFYDPKQKSKLHGKKRLDFIQNHKGTLFNFLKREKIHITCVINCLESL